MADKTTDNFPRRDPHKLRTVASFMLGGAATLTVGAVGYGIATNPDLQSPSGLASILAERSDSRTDDGADNTVPVTVVVTETTTVTPSESVPASKKVSTSTRESAQKPTDDTEPSVSSSVEPQGNTGTTTGDPRYEGHTSPNGAGSYTPGSVHHISWGETLAGISAQYGVSVDKLVAINSIVDPDLIYAGSALQLP